MPARAWRCVGSDAPSAAAREQQTLFELSKRGRPHLAPHVGQCLEETSQAAGNPYQKEDHIYCICKRRFHTPGAAGLAMSKRKRDCTADTATACRPWFSASCGHGMAWREGGHRSCRHAAAKFCGQKCSEYGACPRLHQNTPAGRAGTHPMCPANRMWCAQPTSHGVPHQPTSRCKLAAPKHPTLSTVMLSAATEPMGQRPSDLQQRGFSVRRFSSLGSALHA